MKLGLADRVVVVTGGGSGIGGAISTVLAEEGAIPVILGRSPLDDEFAAGLATLQPQSLFVQVDLADDDACARAVAQVVDRFGHIHALVNNAGASGGAPAETHPVAAWDKVMNLNVRGYFILSQHIAKRSMIGRRSGSIINVASIAGLGGNPSGMNTIAYNTSKGAVINFTRALAAEWGKYHIRVNAICPGFFPSRMTVGTLKAMGEENLANHAPLGRLGDDEDLKGLCALYASDAGKHITGQWLAVDGGVSIVTGG